MSLMKKTLQAAVAILALTAAAALAKDVYRVAVIRWDPTDIYFNGVQMGQELERQRLEKAHGVKIEFRVSGANNVNQQRTEIETHRTYALMRATKDVIGGYACGGRDSQDDENTDTPAHS